MVFILIPMQKMKQMLRMMLKQTIELLKKYKMNLSYQSTMMLKTGYENKSKKAPADTDTG